MRVSSRLLLVARSKHPVIPASFAPDCGHVPRAETPPWQGSCRWSGVSSGAPVAARPGISYRCLAGAMQDYVFLRRAAALLARDGGAMTPGGLSGWARIQPCASMIEASQSLWMPTIVF